jgi:hypothetical protein
VPPRSEPAGATADYRSTTSHESTLDSRLAVEAKKDVQYTTTPGQEASSMFEGRVSKRKRSDYEEPATHSSEGLG